VLAAKTPELPEITGTGAKCFAGSKLSCISTGSIII
jgi:hypothetical protein